MFTDLLTIAVSTNPALNLAVILFSDLLIWLGAQYALPTHLSSDSMASIENSSAGIAYTDIVHHQLDIATTCIINE